MKILFILPRFNKGFGTVYNENETGIDYDYLMPVGMPYIASYLKHNGCDVSALNLNHTPGLVKNIVQKTITDTHYDFVFTGTISIMYPAVRDIIKYVHEASPNTITVCGGGIISSNPELMMKLINPHYGIIFEGEETALELIQTIEKGQSVENVKGIIYSTTWPIPTFTKTQPRPQIKNLDALPFPDLELFGYSEYLKHQELGGWNQYPRDYPPRPYMLVSARGCSANCLSGDTLIATTNGNIKIKDLVGQTPKVLTRDPITKDVLYAQSSIVAKTGENKNLVRVSFKEGGYIDCTPDHKFVKFLNSNQYVPLREYETEAQFLRPGDSVRAVHYKLSTTGYTIIIWGRKKHRYQHTLIMESMIGRKLSQYERVHHNDHNQINNVEKNLTLTDNHKHIPTYHPELSQRMKDNNPAKNLPHEFFVQRGKEQRGKVRSIESRMNYKASKTGNKNPMWKGGCGRTTKSRIPGQPDVNHVVKSVEPLDGLHNTYCLEVPGYNWFYANDVLVHNCTFCDHTTGPKYRYRSAENIMSEIKYVVEKYHINFFTFLDELFSYDKARALEFCRQFKEYQKTIPWRIEMYCNLRVDCADAELLDAMKSCGNVVIGLGLESYNQKVLDSMRKHITPAQIETTLGMIAERNLVPQGGFIFGDNAETLSTARTTLQFIREHPHLSRGGLFMGFIIPFPGTAIYKHALQNGIIKDEIEFINKLTSTDYNYDNVCNLTNLSDEDFDTLKNEVFTLKYTAIPVSVPTKITNDEIFVKCPHCGKMQTYKTTKRPHAQFSVGVICNNPECNGRFEMGTRYIQLGRLAVKLLGFKRMRRIKNWMGI